MGDNIGLDSLVDNGDDVDRCTDIAINMAQLSDSIHQRNNSQEVRRNQIPHDL